ncbi:MAG TPA: helix-turn-helix domain-containing protein [Microbacteriaceae bacterium]|nr:helix-turn-helix domain-containing protein [Microbacteriaceae bacterium]
MSVEAIKWVEGLEHDRCKGLAYRVLVKLAWVASVDGTRAWRSKAGMADELGVSQQSIRRALRELESLRLVKRGDQQHVRHLPGNRRPVVYNLQMPSTTPELFDRDEDDSGATELSTGGTKSASRGYKTGNYPSIEEIELSSTQGDPGTGARDGARCILGHRLGVAVGDAPPMCGQGHTATAIERVYA